MRMPWFAIHSAALANRRYFLQETPSDPRGRSPLLRDCMTDGTGKTGRGHAKTKRPVLMLVFWSFGQGMCSRFRWPERIRGASLCKTPSKNRLKSGEKWDRVPIRPKAERQLRLFWHPVSSVNRPPVPIRPKAERQLRLVWAWLFMMYSGLGCPNSSESRKAIETGMPLWIVMRDLLESQFVRKPKGN